MCLGSGAFRARYFREFLESLSVFTGELDMATAFDELLSGLKQYGVNDKSLQFSAELISELLEDKTTPSKAATKSMLLVSESSSTWSLSDDRAFQDKTPAILSSSFYLRGFVLMMHDGYFSPNFRVNVTGFVHSTSAERYLDISESPWSTGWTYFDTSDVSVVPLNINTALHV